MHELATFTTFLDELNPKPLEPGIPDVLSPLRASHASRSLSLFCVLCLACIAMGCKSTKPDVGVRPEFKGVQVNQVVMTPFYLSSGMGLEGQARDVIKQTYEQQTQAWLEAQGFEVVSATSFQQQLTEAGAWQIYADGLTFRNSLDRYFMEPMMAGSRSAETVALKQLKESGALPEGALLFGEVVYQTQTNCRVYADESVDFAVVESVPEMDGVEGEVPCVVGHLQSMLVDPNTEQVMWINRGLVELHVKLLTEAMTALNIKRVVDFVYSGKQGLSTFKK